MNLNIKQLLSSVIFITLIGCGSDDRSSPTVQAYPESKDIYEGTEGDNTPETATQIAIGTSYTKTLFPARDTDWTTITLEAGTEYEISVNKLCASCDTKVYLFEEDAESETGYTQLAYNDDKIYLDSSVIYTPEETKTYYVHVTPYNEEYGISTYTLNVHEHVDYDEDGYSSYYDCNDQDNSIAPEADEIREDGIDQDCTGSDLIENTTQDHFESDNTIADATPLNILELGFGEAAFIFQHYANDVHTLHDENDVDWFSINLPAHSAIGPSFEYGSNYSYTIYEADGETEVSVEGDYIANTTDADLTYYLKVTSTSNGYYIPTAYFYGFDLDKDGYYSMNWSDERDCNDNDAEINPDMEETNDDSIDSNCDGLDNTTVNIEGPR